MTLGYRSCAMLVDRRFDEASQRRPSEGASTRMKKENTRPRSRRLKKLGMPCTRRKIGNVMRDACNRARVFLVRRRDIRNEIRAALHESKRTAAKQHFLGGSRRTYSRAAIRGTLPKRPIREGIHTHRAAAMRAGSMTQAPRAERAKNAIPARAIWCSKYLCSAFKSSTFLRGCRFLLRDRGDGETTRCQAGMRSQCGGSIRAKRESRFFAE
ncbi:Uncharacterised protein [Burkholderia oklahomensis]|nr:hypothetical protein BG90_4380 [Burkholderia oklahomensis C6786]SUY27844.1 Uncharacterised protein [Burkholderia oklahomensis]